MLNKLKTKTNERGRESTMWIISLCCLKLSCPSVPSRKLGLVRPNLDFGSWNTDTVIVASSFQLCDWKALHRFFWQPIWTTAPSEVPRHQVGYWIISIRNSFHKHMVHCRLVFPPSKHPLNNNSTLSFSFMLFTIICYLIKFWVYYAYLWLCLISTNRM